MKVFGNLKSYMFTPTKCYIPKCLAHCCTNVPLPEGFVESHTPFLQREIYSAINIGINDIKQDKFNSIIYNTTPNPLQLIGVSENGLVCKIPDHIMKQLNEQQIQACIEHYNQFENYCPFITNHARCSLYEQRPRICREYGTFPGIENICREKSSRYDILKLNLKDFFDFKGTFKWLGSVIQSYFKK